MLPYLFLFLSFLLICIFIVHDDTAETKPITYTRKTVSSGVEEVLTINFDTVDELDDYMSKFQVNDVDFNNILLTEEVNK